MTQRSHTESDHPSPPDDAIGIVRDERDAALRALTGRLAHELRNPLAAVRAACSSLHDDVRDTDHRYRLALTLREVDRVLESISATVLSVARPQEPTVDLDPAPVVQSAVAAARSLHRSAQLAFSSDPAGPLCQLAEEGFRTAIFAVLDHLISTEKADAVAVRLARPVGRLQVQFTPVPARTGFAQLGLGLLVAERFSRDAGGQLQWPDDDGPNCLTMDLPCNYV